ncbi:MAG: dihydroorotase [Glaciecola sp.]|jgi:dihydroorotase
MVYIKNATVVNEGKSEKLNVLIEDDKIKEVFPTGHEINDDNLDVIDATGLHLLPGLIDDQVHFREPGLTHKGEIYTESRAAVAGGITSFMEMPNTNPQTTTHEEWEKKMAIGAKNSKANYGFFFGATNENMDEVLAVSPKDVPGIKIFMGSSTGNMLVDDRSVLDNIFSKSKLLIATHCEDEKTIRANTTLYKEKYGENLPIRFHPEIRSAEACYLSSSLAVEIAKKHDTRLHILHISTAKEVDLFSNELALKDKRITAEACIHHLWFSQEDYDKYGTNIKWNPAVKKASDRDAIMQGVLDDKIDIIATDHAPHTKEEKNNSYFNAPSGGPLVQHALVAMLELVKNGKIKLEKAVEKLCHAPADCFRLYNRGFIKKGYQADLVLVDLNDPWTVSKDNILYKCGWSPFEGTTFSSKIKTTFVNGEKVYDQGKVIENTSSASQSLKFNV